MNSFKTNYTELNLNLKGLVEGTGHPVANLANAAALLFDRLQGINWAGFYILEESNKKEAGATIADGSLNAEEYLQDYLKNSKLVLGPFCGKPACIEIAIGKGVCGTAVYEDATELVPDVHKFPGHIACDGASNSEIVVPLHKDGRIYGVLDIDSPYLARFDAEDQKGLEEFAKIIEEFAI